jgi:predicted nucleic acid-binding protein
MKILLDTNVVLDILLERNLFVAHAREIFQLIESQKIEGYLCATTVTTLHYLVSRQLDKPTADHAIKQLLALFAVAPVDKNTLLEASSGHAVDYEDAVLYLSAHHIQMDMIITRDPKGFVDSPVDTLSPEAFLALYKTGEER